MKPAARASQHRSLTRAAAFSVHVFTACGAACAMLALMAAVRTARVDMFLWLGVAVFIDGVDGTLARRLHVAERVPRWSGDALDLVVDILTYVFVPAYAMATSGLLPGSLAVPLALTVVITGVIYFADRLMKTPDNYFRGFPALWNLFAFYLFLLKPPPWLGSCAIVLLAAACFAPVYFVHPVRVTRWRAVTLAALCLWGAIALLALAENLDPGFWPQLALCGLAIYFVGIGFARGKQP